MRITSQPQGRKLIKFCLLFLDQIIKMHPPRLSFRCRQLKIIYKLHNYSLVTTSNIRLAIEQPGMRLYFSGSLWSCHVLCTAKKESNLTIFIVVLFHSNSFLHKPGNTKTPVAILKIVWRHQQPCWKLLSFLVMIYGYMKFDIAMTYDYTINNFSRNHPAFVMGFIKKNKWKLGIRTVNSPKQRHNYD